MKWQLAMRVNNYPKYRLAKIKINVLIYRLVGSCVCYYIQCLKWQLAQAIPPTTFLVFRLGLGVGIGVIFAVAFAGLVM